MQNRLVLRHSGAFRLGVGTAVRMMPSEQLAIVVLTNAIARQRRVIRLAALGHRSLYLPVRSRRGIGMRGVQFHYQGTAGMRTENFAAEGSGVLTKEAK